MAQGDQDYRTGVYPSTQPTGLPFPQYTPPQYPWPSQIEDARKQMQSAHEFRINVALEVLKVGLVGTSELRVAAEKVLTEFLTGGAVPKSAEPIIR